MTFSFGLVLQILILTTGIYFVFGFLRTTRGSGLVRGFTVTLLVGFLGLWIVSKNFNLEELQYIIHNVAGYVAVILVIIFQPELRRAMTHLGDNPFLGRLLQTRRREVVTEVAQSMIQMAKKRQGALVAFERQIALDAFIEGAVTVDAEVNRILLDSIFHHGGALHDGAVILRGERIAAAAALFPLTENIEISKSTGTRHRAALGLTEETDAVTVAVSEETGFISICKGGKMERNVTPTKLEDVLRARIGSDEVAGAAVSNTAGQSDGAPGIFRRAFVENAGLKLGSLAMAILLYWAVHQEITTTQPFSLTVKTASEGAAPVAGQMQIVLPPGQNFHRVAPLDGATLDVLVTGTRAQVDELQGGFGGMLLVSRTIEPGAQEFPLDDVVWSAGRLDQGVHVEWASTPAHLEVHVSFRRERFTLGPEHVIVDASNLSPRYQALAENVFITPASVEIEGPVELIDVLNTEELPLALEEIKLLQADVADRVENLRLAEDLRSQGLALIGRSTVEVKLEILPTEHFLPVQIEKEIALVCRSYGRGEEVELWNRPSQKALFGVRTLGILDETDPDSPEWIAKTATVRQFVEDNLWVFVDVADLIDGGGQVEVRWDVKKSWRDAFGEEMGAGDPRAELVPVLESESHILLIPKKPAESGAVGDGRTPGGD